MRLTQILCKLKRSAPTNIGPKVIGIEGLGQQKAASGDPNLPAGGGPPSCIETDHSELCVEAPARWQEGRAPEGNNQPEKHAGHGGRQQIDRSRVPALNESDLDEFFVAGHGPGGQSVNKAVNCCQLRHNPSGIVVKVHQTRSLEKNRQLARELLTEKLDNLYNGEASVASQKKRLALQHIATRAGQSERRRALKEQYKRKLGQLCQSETDGERP